MCTHTWVMLNMFWWAVWCCTHLALIKAVCLAHHFTPKVGWLQLGRDLAETSLFEDSSTPCFYLGIEYSSRSPEKLCMVVVTEFTIVTFWCIVSCPPKLNDVTDLSQIQWRTGRNLSLHQSNIFSPIFLSTGPGDTYSESCAEAAQERSN